MAPHEQVQTCRVAAAHLKPIERRKRLLHCEVCSHRCRRRVATRKFVNGTRSAQSVVANRPEGITQTTDDHVGGLNHIGCEIGTKLKCRLCTGQRCLKLVDAGDDARRQFVATHQCLNARNTAQRVVKRSAGVGHSCSTRVQAKGLIERGDDAGRGWCQTRGRLAQNRNDPAHGLQVTALGYV
ncbi:unannotated protein [freshwater metagenome]|uniref:Unannotated protein n=1 Tax=freshwater metagenome TaxID=449393 RepID=A0A6J6NV54_9ZZZZ